MEVRAAELLKPVRNTFSTYTLDNESHSLNVTRLIDRLMGKAMAKMQV